MPKKNSDFRLSEADRKIMEVGLDDLSIFTQYYFDGWTPYEFQTKFYHAPQKDKLLVAGIRTGKTKLIAAGFLHYCFFNPGCRVANASISADQANIVYNDVLGFAANPRFEKFIAKDEKHPYPRIELVNGSEIWFRSVGYEAELWRGWEFDWINIDEAAYITREASISTLKGRLIGVRRVQGVNLQRDRVFTMTTSPKGKGWLFERWKKGRPEFHNANLNRYLSMLARTRDNLALSEEAIAEIEAEYSDKMRRQELEGEFVDSEGLVFPYDQIMYACSSETRAEVDTLDQVLRKWLQKNNLTFHNGDLPYYALDPKPGHNYIQSWDLGKKPTKSGRNAMVGGVIDITEKPYILVGWRYAPGASFGLAHEWIKEWQQKYNQNGASCETVIDATGKGDPVNERLEEEENIDVDGIIYSSVTKPQMVMSLQLMLEKGFIIMPFLRVLVDQLQSYEHNDKLIPQDTVMMLAQAAFRARQRYGEISKGSSSDALSATHRANLKYSQQRMKEKRLYSRKYRTGRVE